MKQIRLSENRVETMRASQRIIIVREKAKHDLGRLSGLEANDSRPFTRSVDAELRALQVQPMHSVELPTTKRLRKCITFGHIQYRSIPPSTEPYS